VLAPAEQIATQVRRGFRGFQGYGAIVVGLCKGAIFI
jgi:hypothetical protein